MNPDWALAFIGGLVGGAGYRLLKDWMTRHRPTRIAITGVKVDVDAMVEAIRRYERDNGPRGGSETTA